MIGRTGINICAKSIRKRNARLITSSRKSRNCIRLTRLHTQSANQEFLPQLLWKSLAESAAPEAHLQRTSGVVLHPEMKVAGWLRAAWNFYTCSPEASARAAACFQTPGQNTTPLSGWNLPDKNSGTRFCSRTNFRCQI